MWESLTRLLLNLLIISFCCFTAFCNFTFTNTNLYYVPNDASLSDQIAALFSRITTLADFFTSGFGIAIVCAGYIILSSIWFIICGRLNKIKEQLHNYLFLASIAFVSLAPLLYVCCAADIPKEPKSFKFDRKYNYLPPSEWPYIRSALLILVSAAKFHFDCLIDWLYQTKIKHTNKELEFRLVTKKMPAVMSYVNDEKPLFAAVEAPPPDSSKQHQEHNNNNNNNDNNNNNSNSEPHKNIDGTDIPKIKYLNDLWGDEVLSSLFSISLFPLTGLSGFIYSKLSSFVLSVLVILKLGIFFLIVLFVQKNSESL